MLAVSPSCSPPLAKAVEITPTKLPPSQQRWEEISLPEAHGKPKGRLGDKAKPRSWSDSEFQGALEAGIAGSVRLCEGRASGRRIPFPMPLADRDPREPPAHRLEVEEEKGSG